MHVQLGLGGQIEDAPRRLHIEHELELLLAVLQPEAAVDLLDLIQVDDALQLAARVVDVVLEAVLAGDFALLEGEPAAAPTLRNANHYWSELYKLADKCVEQVCRVRCVCRVRVVRLYNHSANMCEQNNK